MNAVFPEEPFWTPSRVVSGLIVTGYVLLGYRLRGGEAALRLLGFCLLPLMCIWFSEFLGSHTTLRITAPSPPALIHILGWLLLLLPAIGVLLARGGG